MLEQTTINAPKNFWRAFTNALGIQPGEGLVFMLLFSQAFCLGITMISFYTTANSLFLSVFEASTMPYVYIVSAVTLASTGVIFAQLERRLPISVLLVGTQGFLLISIMILWLSLQFTTAPWLIFIVMAWLRLVWVVGNFQLGVQIGYLFNLRQGKRLYALIVAAPVFAVIILSLFTTPLINLIGIVNLLLLGAGGIVLSMIFLFVIIGQFKGILATSPKNKTSGQSKSPPRVQLRTLLQNRFVLFFFIFTILSTLNTNVLDYAFVTETDARFSDADVLGRFFGTYLGVSTFFLLLIALSTAQIFKRYGVKGGILFNPVFVGIGGLVAIIIGGVFNWVDALFWLTVLTKLTDDAFVVLNTSRRNLLYQPLPENQRVTVQTMIESVIAPLSLGLVGIILLGFQLIGTLSIIYILALFLALIVITLISGIFLNRTYATELKQALVGRHLHHEASPFLVNKDEIELFQQALKNPQPSVVIYALTILSENNPELLAPLLPDLLDHPVLEVRQSVLEHIEQLALISVLPALKQRIMVEPEPSLRGLAVRTLATLGRGEVRDEVFNWLDDSEVEVRRGAMIGLLRSGGLKGTLLAGQRLLTMVEAPDPLERAMAAQILGQIGVHTFYEPLIQLLNDNSPQVQRAAIIAAGQLKSRYLWPLVIDKLKSPQVSQAAVSALVSGGEETLGGLEAAFTQTDQTLPVLILITRIFARIRGEQVIACLQDKFNYPHPTIRSHILYALSRCHYQVEAGATAQVEQLEQQIEAEVAHTAWILGILVALQTNSQPDQPQEALSFLQAAINEDLNETRSRIFYLLSFIYDPQAILRVRDIFGYTHASAKQKAYALEMIDILVSRDLKEKIFPLLTGTSPQAQLKSLQVIFPQAGRTLAQCLQDLMTASADQVNSWLKVCTLYAVGVLGQAILSETVRSALTASNPLLRETALWTLNQLQILEEGDLAQLGNEANLQVAQLVAHLKNKAADKEIMLSTVERVLFLKGIDLFEQLPGEDLVRIAQVAQKITFSAQETFLKEGELGDCLYIIIAGEAQIKVAEIGQIATLGERNVIGEMAILADNHRTASAVATTAITALKIEREDFQELLAEKPELALGISKVLVERLERASRKTAPVAA